MSRKFSLRCEPVLLEVQPPPGFSSYDSSTPELSSKQMDESVKKQQAANAAWATAVAPLQQLLMTGLMLWLSGNSLQIFSIFMLAMAFWQPFSRILNVNTGGFYQLFFQRQITNHFIQSLLGSNLPKWIFSFQNSCLSRRICAVLDLLSGKRKAWDYYRHQRWIGRTLLL